MQNDRFAEQFFAVAETDPETATEIALALFTSISVAYLLKSGRLTGIEGSITCT